MLKKLFFLLITASAIVPFSGQLTAASQEVNISTDDLAWWRGGWRGGWGWRGYYGGYRPYWGGYYGGYYPYSSYGYYPYSYGYRYWS